MCVGGGGGYSLKKSLLAKQLKLGDYLSVQAHKPQEFVFKSEMRLKNKLEVFEDLEFWLFGLFNRTLDLNTSSCAQTMLYRSHKEGLLQAYGKSAQFAGL